jgi:ubiquitin carboxyl-terminal hydrolase L3
MLVNDIAKFYYNTFNLIIDAYESHRKKEEEALSGNPPAVPEKLFYMKQFISNSCGTMALIHSVFNNLDSIKLDDGSVMKKFYDSAKDLSTIERGKLLVKDSAFVDTHQALAAEGQTTAPSADEKVNHHFISFVNVNNELFELDGSKNFPISHGSTTEEKFLVDAARVCKEFIARDPKEVNFTIMALANAQ